MIQASYPLIAQPSLAFDIARRHSEAIVGSALYRMVGIDLMVLEGINASTTLVLLSEIGPDGQSLVDLPSEKVTDVPMLRTEGLIVL